MLAQPGKVKKEYVFKRQINGVIETGEVDVVDTGLADPCQIILPVGPPFYAYRVTGNL